jgi:hypothetical protein
VLGMSSRGIWSVERPTPPQTCLAATGSIRYAVVSEARCINRWGTDEGLGLGNRYHPAKSDEESVIESLSPSTRNNQRGGRYFTNQPTWLNPEGKQQTPSQHHAIQSRHPSSS